MSADDPEDLDQLIRETRRADTIDTFRATGRIARPIAVVVGAWLIMAHFNPLPRRLHLARQLFWRVAAQLF